MPCPRTSHMTYAANGNRTGSPRFTNLRCFYRSWNLGNVRESLRDLKPMVDNRSVILEWRWWRIESDTVFSDIFQSIKYDIVVTNATEHVRPHQIQSKLFLNQPSIRTIEFGTCTLREKRHLSHIHCVCVCHENVALMLLKRCGKRINCSSCSVRYMTVL